MMIITAVNKTAIGLTIVGSRAICDRQSISVLAFKLIINTSSGLVVATEYFTYVDNENLLGTLLSMQRADIIAALKLSQEFPTLGDDPQIRSSVHPADNVFVIPAVTWAGIGQ